MEQFGIWQWIGLALGAWVLWDLFSGSVYLHRRVARAAEPSLYWGGMALWTTVAATCFIGSAWF